MERDSTSPFEKSGWSRSSKFLQSDAVLLESEIAKLSDDATAFLFRVGKILDAP
jgi:hypothetical protein